MSRLDVQRNAMAELVAEVTLYSTVDGGRREPIPPGYGCPCMISKNPPLNAWDGLLLLRDIPLNPGEVRRIGFAFLSGQEAAGALKAAGRFYLWEGRFIGEAVVVA